MAEDKHKQRFGSFIQDLRKKLQKTKKPTNFKKANYKFRLGQKPRKKFRKKKKYQRWTIKKIFRKKFSHKRKRRKRKKLWIKTFTRKGRLLFKRKWKRYFIWKKRKHRKRIKNLFNFTYFFCKRKQFTPKLSRRWIFFQLRREELPSKVVDKIFEKIKWSVKLRRTFKLKKTLKKKSVLKKKLMFFFRFKHKKIFKVLKSLTKKKNNKALFLIFFFESLLPMVCLRFHFFWKIPKAHKWISFGVISVNSLRVFNKNYRIYINDFIKAADSPGLFFKFVTLGGIKRFHKKFYTSVNYSELHYLIKSGILLKIPINMNEIKFKIVGRRKSWFKKKTFLYLTNSFY